jgi:hypothetical protein
VADGRNKTKGWNDDRLVTSGFTFFASSFYATLGSSYIPDYVDKAEYNCIFAIFMSTSNTPLQSPTKTGLQWRSMTMRYPNKCVTCRQRLEVDQHVYYALPNNQWSFKCCPCHERAENIQLNPSLAAVVSRSPSVSGSMPTSPAVAKKRPLDPITPPRKSSIHAMAPEVLGMMAQMSSPRPDRMAGQKLQSPMKEGFQISVFRSKMWGSICESCNRVIYQGDYVQGQKICAGHWIVTCYPPCYEEKATSKPLNSQPTTASSVQHRDAYEVIDLTTRKRSKTTHDSSPNTILQYEIHEIDSDVQKDEEEALEEEEKQQSEETNEEQAEDVKELNR